MFCFSLLEQSREHQCAIGLGCAVSRRKGCCMWENTPCLHMHKYPQISKVSTSKEQQLLAGQAHGYCRNSLSVPCSSGDQLPQASEKLCFSTSLSETQKVLKLFREKNLIPLQRQDSFWRYRG